MIRQLAVEGESLDDIGASLHLIAKTSERKSVEVAAEKLQRWRTNNSGEILFFEDAIYKSPESKFKVKYSPNFGIRLGSSKVAIHVWNTMAPPLVERSVRAALALFENGYETTSAPPDDIAVLCLRTEKLFRLGEAGHSAAVGRAMAIAIDRIFQKIEDERPQPPSPGDQPPAPPPGS